MIVLHLIMSYTLPPSLCYYSTARNLIGLKFEPIRAIHSALQHMYE